MIYGIEDGSICEPAQVIVHLPENWTKILLVRTYGLGLANGGAYWDIPTETIPLRLRFIGARFVISSKIRTAENLLEQGRGHICQSVKVEELPEADRYLWPECNQNEQPKW